MNTATITPENLQTTVCVTNNEEKCAVLLFNKVSENPTIGAIFTKDINEAKLENIIKKCLTFEGEEIDANEVTEAALVLLNDDDEVKIKDIHFKLNFEFLDRFTLEDY